MAVCNPAELLEAAKCFQCLSRKELQMVIVQLLCDIEAGGGGGGGTTNMSGAGSPVGVVTPTAINIWYHDTTGNTWWWATGLTDADWIQVV